jgi:division protein CdvB (Snf7/Vps24/ESCRT-III family)
MPQVSFELGMIGETLSAIVIEVGEAMNSDYDTSPSSSEVQKTLAEADSMAEQKMSKTASPRYPWQQPVTTASSEHTRV